LANQPNIATIRLSPHFLFCAQEKRAGKLAGKESEKAMNTKQLKELIAQIEALKIPDTSSEFQAGVDAAIGVLDTVMQEAADRDRMQKLETELSALRAKYPDEGSPAPKRRGRKPKLAM
jgi:hypothetical protein